MDEQIRASLATLAGPGFTGTSLRYRACASRGVGLPVLYSAQCLFPILLAALALRRTATQHHPDPSPPATGEANNDLPLDCLPQPSR